MLVFSAIGTTLKWCLIGSYRTGELIVYTGISFIEMLVNTVRSFNTVSVLICEGTTLWLEDIREFLTSVNDILYNGYDYLSETGNSIVSITAKAVYSPFSVIAAILTSIRDLVLLLGSSCLFLLSLPPLFLFYIIDTLLHAVKTFGHFGQYIAKRFTEHAADIRTLEALLGLIVGCGMLIITINGIKFLAKSYPRIKNLTARVLRNIWRTARTRVSIATRRRGRIKDVKSQETELCIVCFEEARSVCFLPCRHLCLCINCTQLLSEPLKCPLCRQRAEDLIHVYL